MDDLMTAEPAFGVAFYSSIGIMPAMSMREATVSDLNGIAVLEAECFDDPWPKHLLKKYLLEKLCRTVVWVDSNGAVRGCVMARRTLGIIVIDSVCVAPLFRRMRIGTDLIGSVLYWSAGTEERTPMVRIDVSEKWMDCHLLLRSVGFKATEVLRGRDGNEDNYQFDFDPRIIACLPPEQNPCCDLS